MAVDGFMTLLMIDDLLIIAPSSNMHNSVARSAGNEMFLAVQVLLQLTAVRSGIFLKFFYCTKLTDWCYR